MVNFFKPAAQEKWTAELTAASSIVGLFTVAAILIDGFTDAAATPALVAAIVGIQSTLSGTSNFENGFSAQQPDSTYLAIDGNYSQGALNYVETLQLMVDDVWNSTNIGSSGLEAVLSSGLWLDAGDFLNQTGLRPSVTDWWDDIMVATFINLAWVNNDVFITFIPYGTVDAL